MATKSTQTWLVIALGAALALVIAIHHVLVSVDLDACFENYANSVFRGAPIVERVGEMSSADLLRSTWAKIGRDDILLFTLGLLPLCPFLIAVWSAKTPASAMLWTISAAVVSSLLVGYYVWSLFDLYGGSTEFHDCDRKGVSLGIAVAPVMFSVINAVAIPILSFSRMVVRAFSGAD